MLCNWLVCLAVVLAMTTTSTIGKIACAWMPIFIFFAQGFEHSVVNMFIIPTGMMMGAKVTVADWWLWNQIPVTLGNLVGGFTFTGLAIYMTYKPRGARPRCRRRRRPACPPNSPTIRDLQAEGRANDTEDLMSGDFEPEQKRYLEGFMAGLQIAKTARCCGRPLSQRARAVGADRPRCRGVARPGSRHQGRRQAVGSGKIQARAQSARRLRAAQGAGRQQRSAEGRRQFPLAVFRACSTARRRRRPTCAGCASPTASSLIGSSKASPISPNAMPAATPT